MFDHEDIHFGGFQVCLHLSPLLLTDSDKRQVQEWASAYGTPQQVALRSRIVLAAAEGQSDNSIAQQLAIHRKTVMLWQARFAEQGLPSLWEIAPGRGRKAAYARRKSNKSSTPRCNPNPRAALSGCCRSLAKRVGISKSTVNNVWRSHNLKPHRVKTFKLSRDPHFLEKLTDVVGLYLNPPEHAMVLCVDGKPGWVRSKA